jgi:membrane-bound lytic murein transglycosylase B
MPPLNRARRRALRAILSAVAGGGLTAAGIGGPLASEALAATPVAPEGASPAVESGGANPETETSSSSTTTSTTPAPTTTPAEPTTAPTSSTPTATTPTSTAPTTTAAQPATPAPAASEAPAVVLQRKQKVSASAPLNPTQTTTGESTSQHEKSTKPAKSTKKKASGPNGVASSPQMVAAEAGQLVAMLASAEASDQALGFYRIPLFLLPIYKAAAVQYGVPWQILAAINEIETDYGSDLSVSTAGAVGWMQFMPSTWLQYGVDALNAGYADPYNPVDAVFAAARYLRAAGAATNLRAAILAYNHSEEYVESVLLRAKLISTYPKGVIATLTGLIDGRLPVTGKRVAWNPLPVALPSTSSATANATAVPSSSAASGAAASSSGTSASGAGTPGSSAALSPAAAAAAATGHDAGTSQSLQLIELLSSPHSSVVAVQDGRIVHIGDSRKLGKYVVLRDVYGDVFTYAGLGSIAPTYVLPKTPVTRAKSPVVEAASTHGPAPSQPASAGIQSPFTLHVKQALAPAASAQAQVSVPTDQQEEAPAGMDKVRLFAHPGNLDARAAAVASAARKARDSRAGKPLALRAGSVVASGTILGRVRVPPGAKDGHLRFAVRPSGDTETIDPAPILANWAQLQTALHPQGAKATNALLGATASDAFLLSKAQLERAVLSDPGITLDACGRHEIASGMVDRRVLAVLAFLSRSGLEPTVSALHCTARQFSGARSASYTNDEVDISAINGTTIAGHQGPETITDLTIRTLLTLPSEFVPQEIASLMRYPGSPSTHASAADANHIHLEFRPATRTTTLNPAAAATAAHSARAGRTAPSPLVTTSVLSAAQWNQLMQRVGAIPMPALSTKPSSSAVPDPKSRH